MDDDVGSEFVIFGAVTFAEVGTDRAHGIVGIWVLGSGGGIDATNPATNPRNAT